MKRLLERLRIRQSIAEELAAHLEEKAAAFMESGLSEQEARLRARREFGNAALIAEDSRNAVGWPRLDDLILDLRYAFRVLWRSPGFAAVVMLSLALGIGANTAIFTAMDAMLWKPLPVDHPENLVRLVAARVKRNDLIGLPATLAEALNRGGNVFDGAFAESEDGLSFAYDGRAERVVGAAVTSNFFSLLGVKMTLGQPFTESVRAGHWAAEAVLSYRFWQNRFGGDPSIVGRTIHLNTYPFTIVGVSEASFYDVSRGMDPELRIPRMPDGQSLAQIDLIGGNAHFNWNLMARLRPGVTLAQASLSADAQFQEVLRSASDVEEVKSLEVGHLQALPGDRGWPEHLVPFATPLFVLFALVVGVLLIACANVASMLLARAAARRREFAVRCSVGAGRMRLIRQMLAESILLAVLSGMLGIAFSFWCGPMLLHFLPRSNITLVLDLRPDARALLFTSGLALATGVLFGLFPALHSTRGDLAGVLRTDTAASTGSLESTFLRKVLVAGQVALSLAVLIAAGLFVRTLDNLRPHDLRVDANRVLQFMIKPQPEIYSDGQKFAMLEQLIQHLSQVPGVASAALTQPPPFVGNGDGVLVQVRGGNSVRITNAWVTPGILDTLGIRLAAGRDFTAADKPGAPLVVIINQAAAGALFGDENPVGRTLSTMNRNGSQTYKVIGVMEDVHYSGLYQPHRPLAFFPVQLYAPYMPVLNVRINNGNTAGMFAVLRRAFDEVDKGFPVFNVKTMAMQIDDDLARERMIADLASAFGALALALAAMGLYGVLAYSVTRRTREIGIRMALGSSRASLVSIVVREALLLVGIGSMLGLALAVALGRSIAAYLFGVSSLDPLTLSATAGLMLVIAAVAVFTPALRAARIDPLVALRHE
ncbi:MAG TPA: ABC transporter permease [Bryobacteraceae bacterium]|nr:ABC transporter permease [Bryobacteraceae bacterium]